ncbi:MAG: hypothetical protein K9M02_10115 [Thiohalocapsa sp.]|nr:hypothetical protein [Thiohalocapsa sp.]
MGEGSSSQSVRVTPLAATTEGVDRVFSYISVDQAPPPTTAWPQRVVGKAGLQ